MYNGHVYHTIQDNVAYIFAYKGLPSNVAAA